MLNHKKECKSNAVSTHDLNIKELNREGYAIKLTEMVHCMETIINNGVLIFGMTPTTS